MHKCPQDRKMFDNFNDDGIHHKFLRKEAGDGLLKSAHESAGFPLLSD